MFAFTVYLWLLWLMLKFVCVCIGNKTTLSKGAITWQLVRLKLVSVSFKVYMYMHIVETLSHSRLRGGCHISWAVDSSFHNSLNERADPICSCFVVKVPPHLSFPEVLAICFVAISFSEIIVISPQLIPCSVNISFRPVWSECSVNLKLVCKGNCPMIRPILDNRLLEGHNPTMVTYHEKIFKALIYIFMHFQSIFSINI